MRGAVGALAVSSVIGIGFGTWWWFTGSAAVPAAVTVLRIVGVVLALGLLGLTARAVVRGRAWVAHDGTASGDAGQGRPRNPFGARYAVVVLVMVVVIIGGARLLNGPLGRPEAVTAWVLFVVGLHFVPFRWIFRSAVFFGLAGALCLVAVLGAGLGLGGVAGAWTVVPGFGGALVLWGSVLVGLRVARGERAMR